MRRLDALMLSKALRPLRRSQFAEAVIVMENKKWMASAQPKRVHATVQRPAGIRMPRSQAGTLGRSSRQLEGSSRCTTRARAVAKPLRELDAATNARILIGPLR